MAANSDKILQEFLDLNKTGSSYYSSSRERSRKNKVLQDYSKRIKERVQENLNQISKLNGNPALLEPQGTSLRRTTLTDAFKPVLDTKNPDLASYLKFMSDPVENVAYSDGDDDNEGDTTSSAATQAASVTPPANSLLLTENEEAIIHNINAQAAFKIIQQFYNMYMSNIGCKDIDYRLGEVSAVIADRSAIANKSGYTTTNGAIFTATNFNFPVSFEIVDPSNKAARQKFTEEYVNLNLPPYNIPMTTKELVEDNPFTPSEGTITAQDQPVYSLDTLLSNREGATYRFAGFKAINDNIMLMQKLMEMHLVLSQPTCQNGIFLSTCRKVLYLQQFLLMTKQSSHLLQS